MKSKKRILLSGIMIFAFMWVIIGDLVAMHVNVICDIDIFNQHPFAKTNKSDEKNYKTNNSKTSDDNLFLFLFFIKEQPISLNNDNPFDEISIIKLLNYFSADIKEFPKGRSPPIV